MSGQDEEHADRGEALVAAGLAKFVEAQANEKRLSTALAVTQEDLRLAREQNAGLRAELLDTKRERDTVLGERDRWMRFATTLVTQLSSAVMILNDGLREAREARDSLGASIGGPTPLAETLDHLAQQMAGGAHAAEERQRGGQNG